MKYCPECNEEYRDEIEVCADCDVDLVEGEEDEFDDEEEFDEEDALQSDLPEIIEVYRTLDANEAEEKVVYLKKHKIKATIFEHIVKLRNELEVFGSRVFFRLIVSDEDFENARELLRNMDESGIVISETEINELDQVEKTWTCIGCGSELDSADAICEICDEELDTRLCSQCGAVFGHDDDECPSCGEY